MDQRNFKNKTHTSIFKSNGVAFYNTTARDKGSEGMNY